MCMRVSCLGIFFYSKTVSISLLVLFCCFFHCLCVGVSRLVLFPSQAVSLLWIYNCLLFPTFFVLLSFVISHVSVL